MMEVKIAVQHALVACLIGCVFGLSACAGAPGQAAGGKSLKRSAAITSCGTGRATEPGAVDTIDAGWLQVPLRILSYADPVYPPEALSAGRNGEVEVRVLISPDGSIDKILEVKGPPGFSEAAAAAVQGAEVTAPTQSYGRPAVVCATMVVSFQAIEGGVAWLRFGSQ